ncbi:GlxA family transcriptional regulator [Methyloligella sp. 2.7D]|uniref:GlxA family transcriptional regulator n=1 Tax=unclassified Methyloligella TaxID=2625955 RepID=UPI00157BF554|nr:GlxA family transcriptional regulator [Methyloligella sp. GL2]QKP76680.1 GlxA family transcriptional regulator [Methyloligella sp. GL2]
MTPDCPTALGPFPGFPTDRVASARRIGFLTLDEFPTVALSCAIEVLRAANQVVGRSEYQWSIVTAGGETVRSSDGAMRATAVSYAEAAPLDLLLVCGGSNIADAVDEPLITLLRQMADDAVILGGLCSGAYALVKAGLLDGYQCALQWDDMVGLRQAHAGTVFLDRLSVIDRDRISCAGGIAPIELMLSLVGKQLGAEIAGNIAARLGASQQSRPANAIDGAHRPPLNTEQQRLARVVALMEDNLEEPLSATELAEQAGLSLRQVQRVFQLTVGVPLSAYYLRLRLKRARERVLHGTESLTQIAVAFGFASPAHFSRSYKACFGRSPSSERRPAAAAGDSFPCDD